MRAKGEQNTMHMTVQIGILSANSLGEYDCRTGAGGTVDVATVEQASYKLNKIPHPRLAMFTYVLH